MQLLLLASQQDISTWQPRTTPLNRLRACRLSCFSHVQLFVTLWTVARQAPLSVRFSRQEHWSGLSFPPSGDLPDLGIKLTSPAWQVNSLPLSHLGNSMTHQWVTKSIHWVASKLTTTKKGTIEKLKQNACMLNHHFSCVRLLRAVAHQAPLSMGFSRQEYWSGLPCSSPGDLPSPGTEHASLASCVGRRVLYHQHHRIGNMSLSVLCSKSDVILQLKNVCMHVYCISVQFYFQL